MALISMSMLHVALGVVGTPFGGLDELARLSLESPPNLTATATAPAVLHTVEGTVTGATKRQHTAQTS